MYDGASSPCTQTFWLGLFQLPPAKDMEELESFFRRRGAPVFHEVSPIAAKAIVAVMNQRGYQPVEFTSVLFLPVSSRIRASDLNRTIEVRPVGEDECDLWAKTAAEGWRDSVESGAGLFDLLGVAARRAGALSFLAELDGRPVAAGALAIHDGVALFAGASTIPEWRHRGAQRALLERRLDYAIRAGCDLAMICSEPGSASQRNAERHGFRIAYTRVKWRLAGS